MARSISNEYRLAQRLMFGTSDPSGLELDFQWDGNRVFALIESNPRYHQGVSLFTGGLVHSIADDLAHAALSALEKRIGMTRETKLRFLRPLYARETIRADGTISTNQAAPGSTSINVRIYNQKEQLCVEGSVVVFHLNADQIRRMSSDGMVPQGLRNFFR